MWIVWPISFSTFRLRSRKLSNIYWEQSFAKWWRLHSPGECRWCFGTSERVQCKNGFRILWWVAKRESRDGRVCCQRGWSLEKHECSQSMIIANWEVSYISLVLILRLFWLILYFVRGYDDRNSAPRTKFSSVRDSFRATTKFKIKAVSADKIIISARQNIWAQSVLIRTKLLNWSLCMKWTFKP